jgi:hypothetical protein
MPAPVRYRSTAAAYGDGGADRDTTRACGSRSAPPLPNSVTGAIAMSAPPFGHCRSRCVDGTPCCRHHPEEGSSGE